MQKEFISNLVLLVLANLLIKPFYIFGIDRTVQNLVGPEDYGLYFALFNFALIFQIVTDLGLQNYNNRSVSQYPDIRHDQFPSILVVKTIFAIVFLGIIWIAARILKYEGVALDLLFWIGVNTVLVSMILYLRTNISGLGRYRLDSLFSILDKVLMILIIGGWLLTKEDFRIQHFVIGQTLALMISAIIVGSVVFILSRPLIWRKQISFHLGIIRESLPYALVVLFMTIYTRIDGVMLERILEDGSYQAGVYASGYRFFDAANMFGFLIAGLLLPMFSKLLARKQNIFPLYHLSMRCVWLLVVFIASMCYVFKSELVHLLYVNATEYWGEVLGILMVSFVFVSIGYILGSLLTAQGSIYKLNWIFLIAIILNVGLNLLLIHQFKAYGAALATLFTQGFVVLAQLFYVNRTLDFSLYTYPVKEMIFSGLTIVLLIVTLRHITQTWAGIISGSFIIGIMILAYLYLQIKSSLTKDLINLTNE
ncbi:MAG: oligosaccharide flippase family protein [Bacteroidia bacterium]|nr:oligosaccharide flippase family protein [Bacteroidia bacterium]